MHKYYLKGSLNPNINILEIYQLHFHSIYELDEKGRNNI